jgi:Transglutaminase-like superfamily
MRRQTAPMGGASYQTHLENVRQSQEGAARGGQMDAAEYRAALRAMHLTSPRCALDGHLRPDQPGLTPAEAPLIDAEILFRQAGPVHFAHLAVTLSRCMNIPARYCTGYPGDIGVPADPAPMDFSAWYEVFLDGRWFTLDARHN